MKNIANQTDAASSHDRILSIDVLRGVCMGFATIILFFCRFVPSWTLVAVTAAIALLTPAIRGCFDIAAQWGGAFMHIQFISEYLPGLFVDPVADYSAAWNLNEIIKGFFLNGYFPVLPWEMFPIFGLFLGQRLVRGTLRRDLPLLLAAGVVFVALGLCLAFAGREYPASSVISGLISPLSFYPDSFSLMCVQFGLGSIVFGLFYYFYDIVKKRQNQTRRVCANVHPEQQLFADRVFSALPDDQLAFRNRIPLHR